MDNNKLNAQLLRDTATAASLQADKDLYAALEADIAPLLRRNANFIKELRVQLKPYQSSPTKHEVWLRFQGYIKLIVRGQGAPRSTPAPQPAA